MFDSQYGNAKTIARAIEKKLNPIILCDILDMDNYDIIDFSEKIILIILSSTHNSGSQNAYKFFRWLSNIESESRPFENFIDIAVFSIGDNNHDEFCKVAQDFETQLIRCGASRLVKGPLGIEGKYSGPVGFANQGSKFKEDVDNWINNLEQTVELIVQEEAVKTTTQLVQDAFITQRNNWAGIFFCTGIACLVLKHILRN